MVGDALYFTANHGLIEEVLSTAITDLYTTQPADPLGFLSEQLLRARDRHSGAATGEQIGHEELDVGCEENVRIRQENERLREENERFRSASRAGTAGLADSIAKWRASAPPTTSTSGKELHSRFAAAEGSFTYTYGGVEQFFAGLEGLIGLPHADFLLGMSLEHASDEPFEAWNSEIKRVTTPRSEWIYVVEKPVGDASVPDRAADTKGRPGDWRLRDFAALPPARAAKLLLAEVAGVRLYTGPMYKLYNSVLRARQRGAYVTTLHAINSAILKLARQTKACTVYRGVNGGVLPSEFWEENEHGVRGGVDLAFMSTTTERGVALGYMAQGKATAARMLFEIRMGMIDRGADVAHLSQFPGENEILFAPLTGLEVASAPRDEGDVLIVELRLSCNMHDMTIEQVRRSARPSHSLLNENGPTPHPYTPFSSQVIAKMQTSHTSLLDGMLHGLEHSRSPERALAPLRTLKAAAATRGSEYFNVPDLFLAATREALETHATCFELLAAEEDWSSEGGTDGEGGDGGAECMRAVAELCAREERHEVAATLLARAARERGGGDTGECSGGLQGVWRAALRSECSAAIGARGGKPAARGRSGAPAAMATHSGKLGKDGRARQGRQGRPGSPAAGHGAWLVE